MRSIFLLSAIFLIQSPCVFGQQVLKMEKYLGSALRDQSLEKYHAQLDFLDQHRFNAPWLNRVEFRIGSENADVSFDEYRLRITPANPYEIKANKLYYQKQLESINSEYEVALNEALLNRYELLIGHYYHSQLVSVLTQRQKVTDELLKMYQISAFEGFDMNDLIDLESAKSKMMVKTSEYRLELEELEYYISMDMDTTISIDWESDRLISVDQVKQKVLEIELSDSEQNLFVRDAQEKYALREQEFKVEISEARRNIGYVQGNFDSNRGDEINDRIGFQLGVRIPVVSPDKPDLQRDEFKLIKDQDEIREVKELIQKRSKILLMRLNNLFDRHDILEARMQEAQRLSVILSADKSLAPKQIVQKNLYELELAEERAEVQKDIYENYLDFLNIQGLLIKRPLKNYLSPNAQPIQQE